MPEYQLFADFNRSGSLTRTSAEHAARSIYPGAIVAPNLDNDGRRLPDTVAVMPEALIDANRDAKPANDNEPMPLLLAAGQGAGPNHLTVVVTAYQANRVNVRLLDERRRVMRPVPGTVICYDLGVCQNDVSLFIECKTLAGSPLTGFPTLTPRRAHPRRNPPPTDERRFTVTLNSTTLAGGVVNSDQGIFTIAPWIMVDGTAPLRRLYIVETDSNHPSVADLRLALPNPDKLFLVPNTVADNDTWLQDQFELGCFHTPAGFFLALLHMPRLRKNYTGRGAASGLPNFVRSHFPSRDVAVFDEFWQRVIPVDDIQNRRVNLSFEQSSKVHEALQRPFNLRSLLLKLANHVLSRNPLANNRNQPQINVPLMTVSSVLEDNNRWLPLVNDQLNRDIENVAATKAEMLRSYQRDLRYRAELTNEAIRVQSGGVRVTAKDQPAPGQTAGNVVWTADISFSMLNRLLERLDQMHHSTNFGGNMELGPPTAGAPYGRIFIGNGVRGSEGFVDVELLNFLDKQRVQPLTQIDTSWLAVAHVDEILSFVPNRSRGHTHAIVLDSSKLALDILNAAERRYIAGLGGVAYDRNPNGWQRIIMDQGTSPVTALFRGKRWKHWGASGHSELLEPPQFYQHLAEHYASQSRGRLSGYLLPWNPESRADWYYPAKMTVRELLWCETSILLESDYEEGQSLSVNDWIQQEKLDYIRGQLENVYPSMPVVLVPTIYDLIREPSGLTGAYTPNAANMVVADDRLLIPKPFGPRVQPADAVAIITEAFQNNGLTNLLAGFNERWLRESSNRLLGVKQWFRKENLPGPGVTTDSDVHRLAREFRDGFPHVSEEEVMDRILRSNSASFRRGDLRSGWHLLTIPEDTVDLFEVAIALAVQSLRVSWRFIDSWTYHVDLGEIHCGTNALREPSFRSGTPWWEYYFQSPPGTG